MKIYIQNYLWVIFYEYQLELMINDQFYEYQLETVLHSWEWASSVGRITTEDNLLMCLAFFCSGDKRGKQAAVPLSGPRLI